MPRFVSPFIAGALLLTLASCSSTKTAVSAASTTTTTTAAATTTSSPVGIRLTKSQYGFLVPADWRVRPLSGAGGSGASASYSDPSSNAVIGYSVEGGETGVLYNADHTPNLTGGVQAISCWGSPPTSYNVAGLNRVEYGCASPFPGFQVVGVLVIDPWNGNPGAEWLQTTLPTSEQASAATILASFKPSR